MKWATTILTLVSITSGCPEMATEHIEFSGSSYVRAMKRGNVLHGWCVEIEPSGTHRWFLYKQNAFIADVLIDPSGQVLSASYETFGYHLEVKSYEPGEPLGSRTLDLLRQIRLEAQRRDISLPGPPRSISPQAITGPVPQAANGSHGEWNE